jgi:hypothetical protein
MKKHIAALRAQEKADSIALDLRYNWDTPYFISPHSAGTLYIGGNRVLKSTDRGDHIYPISPDLSTRDSVKIRISVKTTGGITNDATGAETYGTITTLAESYVRPGLLYAGTDDGNVWLSPNDGGPWENLTSRFPGVPKGTYVARIEPSHADTLTFYVAFDNHRVNDFAPYLYVTTDGGKSFRSIVGNLPTGGPDFVHVIREDPENRNLLFAGTDVGAYVSLDRGAHWQAFMTGLPTVPVNDLKIQPRDHDLIAATHGRSIWIVNIGPLEQMTDTVLAQAQYFFKPGTAYQYGEPPGADLDPGQQVFEGRSAPYGAELTYRLTSGKRGDTAHVVITGVKGDTVASLRGSGAEGLQHVTWDMRGKAPAAKPLSPAALRDSILAARKIDHVFDSLATAKTAPQADLDRIHKALTSGGGLGALFRRNAGGGGAPGVFVERPGESTLPRARGRGARAQRDTSGAAREARAGGPGAGAASGEAPIDQGVLSEVFQALRSSGAIQGGFGRRNQAPLVATGDYLVTITVNGQSMRQVLRVDRVSGGNGEAVDGSFEDPFDP